MSKYIVFWYPTLFHTSFQNRPAKNDAIKDDDISDIEPAQEEEKYPHILHIEKDFGGENTDSNKDKANLLVRTFKQNPSKEGIGGRSENLYNFTLKYEERSNNGFVVYSYNPIEGVDFSTQKGERFLRAVYHHAKQFYHTHEINHTSDSGLRAYVVEKANFKPTDILKANHCALQNYLEQYEIIFKDYAVNVSKYNAWYEKILEYESEFIKKINKNEVDDEEVKKIRILLKTLADEMNAYITDNEIENESLAILLPNVRKHILLFIREMCEDAMVEYAYASTLLYSKYNTEIRQDITFSEDELMTLKGLPGATTKISKVDVELKDRRRKTAININGSVNYLKCIISRCGNREIKEMERLVSKVESLVDSVGKKGTKNTILWAVLGAIISVVIGFLLGKL